MHIQIRYFAAARELAALSEETIELAGEALSTEQLLDALCRRHPRLAAYRGRLRLAVNDDLADGTGAVRDGDQVCVLPPVAGGSPTVLSPTPLSPTPLCALRDQPLSVDEALQAVRHPGAGGIALFIGVVRDHSEGKAVIRLDYEAHPTLALQELRIIAETLQHQHPAARLAALHRTGELAVGEIAVVVAASAPHRDEAFTVCREAIEQLKARVPIWKHEWSPDGDATWVNL